MTKSESLINNVRIRTGYKIISSHSLASLPFFLFKYSGAGWGFHVLYSAQLFFLQCTCPKCKGYWIFSSVSGPLEISKLQITRSRDCKPGMHCSLILQNTVENKNLNTHCGSAELIKFKRYSKAQKQPCVMNLCTAAGLLLPQLTQWMTREAKQSRKSLVWFNLKKQS